MRKSLKRASLYALVRGLMFTARVLPRWACLKFFSTLGVLAFYVLKRDRTRTEINLALAMPHLSRVELRRLSRDVWALLGRNSVDALRLLGMKWEEMNGLVRVEGLRVLEEALSRGRGVVAVTGHIGNWEMLAAYFSMRGYPLSVLARPLRNPELEKLIDRVRRSKGMRPISRISNVKAAYEALKSGGILGVLIDQDTSVKGVFCDFFGRPAFTPSGPAYLAMRTGAAVVPMAISLQRDGTHLVRILEPVHVEATRGHGSGTGSRDTEDSRAHAVTQSYTKAIEELIRFEPAQWVWMHERWKTRLEEQSMTRTGVTECAV